MDDRNRVKPETPEDAYWRAFDESVGQLNRKERRTARGRQIVAEAHAKALQSKIDALERMLKEQPCTS